MPTYKIVHILEQGVNLVIVPLDSGFGNQPDREQAAFIAGIRARAVNAGLKVDVVVPVWDDGSGGMRFIAPQNCHAFFREKGLAWVWASVNTELWW